MDPYEMGKIWRGERGTHISNTDSNITSFTWHSSMSKSRLVLTNQTDPIPGTWFRAGPVSPALVTGSLWAFLEKVVFFLNGDAKEGMTLFSFWVLACLYTYTMWSDWNREKLGSWGCDLTPLTNPRRVLPYVGLLVTQDNTFPYCWSYFELNLFLAAKSTLTNCPTNNHSSLLTWQ